MIFVITSCTKAIFLVIVRIAGDPFVGVDLFDMCGTFLVDIASGRYTLT